jgi:hypothetical protein
MWSPGKTEGGPDGNRGPRPDHWDRQGLEPNEEASGEGEGQGEILWRQATVSALRGTGLRRLLSP